MSSYRNRRVRAQRRRQLRLIDQLTDRIRNLEQQRAGVQPAAHEQKVLHKMFDRAREQLASVHRERAALEAAKKVHFTPSTVLKLPTRRQAWVDPPASSVLEKANSHQAKPKAAARGKR